jgi:FlaA1/EpsC-like NDP-sugar epimerase
MTPRASLTSFVRETASVRVALLFLFHALVFTVSFVLACLLRFEFALPPDFIATFRSSLVAVVLVQLTIGALFSFYRGWWRYVGVSDVIRLVFGLCTATAVLMLLWYTGSALGVPARYIRVPRSVLLIDWAFALLTLFGARIVIRVSRDHLRPAERTPDAQKRVLIVGAGDAGEALAREIQHRPQLGMKIVAFIDDHRAKWGSQIRGIKVYGPIKTISEIAGELRADEALLAIPSASGKRIREIIHHLAEAGLRFKTMPGIDHLVSGKVHLAELRPVNVEDLLRRERIDLPGDPVRQLFRGKRVLVTGAGGTIGAELASQVLQFDPEELILAERSEFALYECHKRLQRESPRLMPLVSCNLVDIRDSSAIDALLHERRPQIVLHAAAHKHVPLGEENPREYIRNNALATHDLAERCVRTGAERFVFISTDKAINPTSVMGATKRAAEIMLLDLARSSGMKISVVRFGNVIGSSGSVIPLFIEQIAAGGPVTVTHPEVTRYFLRTSEAVSLVLQAATLGDGADVFMLDMGEPIKIVDLARDLIQLSSQRAEDIQIVFTGLRAGEKLFEELRLTGETIRPTRHPRIVITEQPQLDHAAVANIGMRLDQAVRDGNDAAVAVMRELVPEFVSPAPSSTKAALVPLSMASAAVAALP